MMFHNIQCILHVVICKHCTTDVITHQRPNFNKPNFRYSDNVKKLKTAV